MAKEALILTREL